MLPQAQLVDAMINKIMNLDNWLNSHFPFNSELTFLVFIDNNKVALNQKSFICFLNTFPIPSPGILLFLDLEVF